MQLTLTDRLRLAALTRAEHGGRVVGTFVIDDEGVIDLRALEDRGPSSRASEPASLKETAGLYGDAADVSDLYVESHERRRRKRRRRAKQKPESSPVGTDSPLADSPDGADEPDPHAEGDDSLTADDVALATPDRSEDPIAAGDRIELRSTSADASTDDRTAPDDEDDEDDEIVIVLRELSDLQTAIIEFNKLGPIVDAEVDVESGIRFGNGRSAAGHDDASPHFHPIKHFNAGASAPEPTSESDRGVLFGRDNSPLFGNDSSPPEIVLEPVIDDDVASDVEPTQTPPPSPTTEHTPTTPPPSPTTEHTPTTPPPSPTTEHTPTTPPPSPTTEHTPTTPNGSSDQGVTETQSVGAAEGGPNLLCPMCGGAATRDFANRLFEIDFYSCNDCFHMWHLEAEDGE